MTDDRVNADRATRLWRQAVDLAGVAPVKAEHACRVTISVARVDGAALAMPLPASPREILYGSDDVALELEDLTLTLGQGPGVDAFTGGPSLVADLSTSESLARWPAFAPEAGRLGVAAMFALPLQIGGIRLGALDLYRVRAGPLEREQLADALLLADTICALLLDERHGDRTFGGRWSERARPHHPEVHQATGMIIVQLGVTAAVALVRLRAYAYSTDRHLRDVAADVVARRLRFDQVDNEDAG